MSGFIIIVFSALLFFFSLISVSASQPYFEIKQLTHNAIYLDSDTPQINDSGYVVYVTTNSEYWPPPSGGYIYQFIYLYNGTNSEQIANPYGYDWFSAVPLQINNDAHVVWESVTDYGEGDNHVFLYDGTDVIQLSSDEPQGSSHSSPVINDNGYVAWHGNDGSGSQVFLFDGASTVQLTDNGGAGPAQINNNGYVVWRGYDGSDSEIFLFDGTSVTQLTYNSYDDIGPEGRPPQINNRGDVVWSTQAGGEDWEIFLYDGTGVIQLTDNSYDDLYPDINDSGHVVWCAGSTSWLAPAGPSDWEIYLYDGTSTTQVSNNDLQDFQPKINNNGAVAWVARPQLGSGLQWFLQEIYFYDGTKITAVTNNVLQDYNVEINNNGQITWQGCQYDFDYELGICDVFLANPSETPPPWGPASTLGSLSSSLSNALNCLLFLLVPISGMGLCRIRRRMKSRN